jgi:hypothetical protein
MKPIWMLGFAALVLGHTVSAAEPFDGSQPMNCKPSSGFDCLPGENACKQLQPEAGRDLTMRIDIHAKALKTPYKKDPLPIASVSFNTASLVLQGTSLEFAWSATVHRTTGKLKIAVVDREGTYVVFGQCTAASDKSPSPPENASSGPGGLT